MFQIPDEEKDAVPEEVKRAAREMGQKAFKERLMVSLRGLLSEILVRN